MFRRALRLFANDWMKFFSKEHRIEPGFSRGLKEITDLNKMIGFIEVTST